MNDDVAKCIYLLLILTVNEVACYDTLDEKFSARNNISSYRRYGKSYFNGIQSKINNQFAEFMMQAATFAESIRRNRAFYFNAAKTCKFLRNHIVALHFIIYTIAVVIPSIFGLLMAVSVWHSLAQKIDRIIKAPPDGVKLPRLVNKPPGFYIPLHRRPIIYLQLAKEKLFESKG